jgi:hypothetical protein
LHLLRKERVHLVHRVAMRGEDRVSFTGRQRGVELRGGGFAIGSLRDCHLPDDVREKLTVRRRKRAEDFIALLLVDLLELSAHLMHLAVVAGVRRRRSAGRRRRTAGLRECDRGRKRK